MPVLFFECVCRDDEVRRRLDERTRAGTAVSDADWAVYQRQRDNYEPFAADERDRVAVDTSEPLNAQLTRAESALRLLTSSST